MLKSLKQNMTMAKNYTALNKEERVCQYAICANTADTNSIASILRTASTLNIKICVAVNKDKTISKWYFCFPQKSGLCVSYVILCCATGGITQ